MGPILVFLGGFVFAVGTVVGSFLNVCIYRIPWEKSVIWPGSRCPQCRTPIAARDNIPIVSWLALRGECRDCGLPISPRYPLVELLVGLLFLGLYYVDVVHGQRGPYGHEIGPPLATWGYHALLAALLVAATFIDYDLFIIPDQITVTGMVLGHRPGNPGPLDPARARRRDHPSAGALGRPDRPDGRRRVDPGRPGGRLRGLPARGDGLRRRDPHGHDRRLPGLAGGRPDVLRRCLLRPGPCRSGNCSTS